MKKIDLEKILFNATEEQNCDITDVEGEIPDFIDGTYLLNGPAKFKTFDLRYNNWLDGDGMVRAMRLKNGKAKFQSRYVNTKKMQKEQEAGKPVYRTFGTNFDASILRRGVTMDSVTNVSVYPFADRLLAFGEQSLPYALNPETLETIEEFNFNGTFIDINPFSAHAKLDPHSGSLCNFGIKYMTNKAKLCYYEFLPDLTLKVKGEGFLPNNNVIHDFALSEKYASFYISPHSLNVRKFVPEKQTLLDSMSWSPEVESQLILFNRENGEMLAPIPLKRKGYSLHIVNSFSREEELIIDLLETTQPYYDEYQPLPVLFPNIKKCSSVRLIVNPTKGELVDVVEIPQNIHFDFPTVRSEDNGIDYQHFWAIGMETEPEGETKFYDRLLRFSWDNSSLEDIYIADENEILGGEPSFIKNSESPEDSLVISQIWNMQTEKSAYVLFKAYDLKSGPIARLNLPKMDPLAFHSCFVSNEMGS